MIEMEAPGIRPADGAPGGALTDGMPLLLFRVGAEWFALDLKAAEEALELPALERVPAMPPTMLGVFPLRGQLIPVYAPDSALGASRAGGGGAGGSEGEGEGVVIVVRARDRRIGLAVDDVEDVIMMDLSKMRRPPGRAAAEQLVLGVLRHGSELVSVIDAAALVSLYTAAPAGEEP